MVKMKRTISLIILLVLLLHFAASSQDDSKLKIEMSKDTLFQRYIKLIDKMVELISTRQVTFKNVDMNYIKLHRNEAKNEQELIDIHEKAGMQNAKPYVETVNALQKVSIQLNSKYPRLSQMTEDERKVFLKSITPATNIPPPPRADAEKNVKKKKEKKVLL